MQGQVMHLSLHCDRQFVVNPLHFTENTVSFFAYGNTASAIAVMRTVKSPLIVVGTRHESVL